MPNKLVKVKSPNNKTKIVSITAKKPILPSDSLFLYMAKDYDPSTKQIQNSIANSKAWGPLLDHGTLSVATSTSGKYLYGTSNTNYLYRTLSNSELEQIKANTTDACFTYIIKADTDGDMGFGGLLSTRGSGETYYYMFRTYNGNIILNYYNTSGRGVDDVAMIPYIATNVYELQVKPTTMTVKNLTNGASASVETGTKRGMTTDFRIMNAGYPGENGVKHFYACYGIDRELTGEEELAVRNCLDTQVIPSHSGEIVKLVRMNYGKEQYSKFRFEFKHNSWELQFAEAFFRNGETEYAGSTYFTNPVSSNFTPFNDNQTVRVLFDGDMSTTFGGRTPNSGEWSTHTVDCVTPISVDTIVLRTGGDTYSYPLRNPTAWKCYGYTDGKWKLLIDSTYSFPRANYTNVEFSIPNG